MHEFLQRSLLYAALIAILSLVFALVLGLTPALICALVLLCGWLFFHLWHVARLTAWLHHPSSRHIPEGYGSWSGIFMALYRQSRKQDESRKRLASTLERFTNAGEAMPDGVIVLNGHDRIDWMNPMAVEHFALERERDVGSQLLNLIRHPAFHSYMAAGSFSQPLTMVTGHARERVLSIQLVPFDLTHKMLLSRDITSLERVQTVHRDFVANVSHELRTPLTVVGGFIETLSDMDEVNHATLKHFLPMMMEQSRRMQRLVEDLLVLSKLENEPKTVEFDKVDMDALLDTLLIEAEGLSHGRHHITLAQRSPDWLWGNSQELHSAFGNLVSNAVRYTPEGGSITLAWQVDANGAHFSVTDTGIGIPREHIPRLTERFYRVDRGRSRSSGGTGLGLAIVKHVVARHRARLEVHSLPEQGSTFSVNFGREHIATAADSAHQD
ncbi:phosphate regulon sensor histidine kinase PhoR [Craterilacuibacter sinensis]|uniref:Phosphate regulon sensor protein PhoR n=1 Tax=Craterilacuibacter sinensis TaxID=2686017 RepID=A0A845BIQ0_9NEIS|nr:phosphate regulon sensor histidine kinase PhoR [Craterilacuibacter sinensis]MXR36052.1 phosphate regulon sensor histidine kinase PhoR [Craterilacuibacter sinensis]